MLQKYSKIGRLTFTHTDRDATIEIIHVRCYNMYGIKDMLQYGYLNIYIILRIYNKDVKIICLNDNVTTKFQTNI